MKALGKRIADNSDALVRKVALAVDGTVVLATPVDTGRARSNWQVAIDQTPEGTVGPYVPGKSASTAGANASAALDAGRAVISGYDGDRNHELHITNNLAYIGRLNTGWSAQAPAGFVEKAVMVGVDAIQSTRITVGKVTE